MRGRCSVEKLKVKGGIAAAEEDIFLFETERVTVTESAEKRKGLQTRCGGYVCGCRSG